MPVPLLSFADLSGETHAGEGGEKLNRFKLWFWAIVEKMSNQQRQDLVRARPGVGPASQTRGGDMFSGSTV